MSVLSAYFDKSVNQSSPVRPDFARVVNYDKDGNEFITYVEVDYPSLQDSHGRVTDWSLDALIKAGINPNFPIHTGNPTRLDGIGDVDSMAAEADRILSAIESGEDMSEDNA